MTDKQKSEFTKTCCLYYLRIKKNFTFVCTEFGDGNADVAGQNKSGKQFEIEIKVSKADLRNEFKHKKWSYNKLSKHRFPFDYRMQHYFICVPPELKDEALEYLKDKEFKGYGLLVCDMRKNIKRYIKTCKFALK